MSKQTLRMSHNKKHQLCFNAYGVLLLASALSFPVGDIFTIILFKGQLHRSEEQYMSGKAVNRLLNR